MLTWLAYIPFVYLKRDLCTWKGKGPLEREYTDLVCGSAYMFWGLSLHLWHIPRESTFTALIVCGLF